MIGHVQSRKAKDVVNHFDHLHSLDRLKLAVRLDRFANETGKLLPVLLQINVSGEETKSGWGVTQEKGFESFKRDVEEFIQLSNLKINGLMTMAPFAPDPEASRIYFRRLFEVREKLKDHFPNMELRTLSMGMSGDFEVAVQEGATMVRVGSAVFNY
jgi:pyridoxal phosphate enzyme (YggS family)